MIKRRKKLPYSVKVGSMTFETDSYGYYATIAIIVRRNKTNGRWNWLVGDLVGQEKTYKEAMKVAVKRLANTLLCK